MIELRVKGVTHRYGNCPAALDNVSFDLAKQECVALIGANGAGKSTLMLRLNGLLTGEGCIEVSGLRVEKRNLAEVRRRVGLVFQDPDDQLIMDTVLEDVAFGPMNMGLGWIESHGRALAALNMVGMCESASTSPQTLSHGQKKRVAIAGILAMRPEVMVLDEPTAGLDPRSRNQIISILRDLSCTRLIATHDLDMAKTICSRVVLLDHGRVAADGYADEILNCDPLLEAHGMR